MHCQIKDLCGANGYILLLREVEQLNFTSLCFVSLFVYVLGVIAWGRGRGVLLVGLEQKNDHRFFLTVPPKKKQKGSFNLHLALFVINLIVGNECEES